MRWAHVMREQWGAFSAPCAQIWSCKQTAGSSTSSTLLTCQQLSTRWLIKLISETKTGGSDGIKSGSFVCSCLCTEGMVSSQQQALMMERRLWLLTMMLSVLWSNGKGFGPWPIWLSLSLPKIYTMNFTSHAPTLCVSLRWQQVPIGWTWWGFSGLPAY